MNARIACAELFNAPTIEARVAPMLLRPLPPSAYILLERYLGLLFQWNQKINLTAMRDPSTLVELHLAECLRAAQRIPEGVKTVLDFGSGAGLPGIPMQIARPELYVTLAESQKKKAAFLREAVRDLNLTRTSVHAGRVEHLPAAQVFDLVTLRAVDKMANALEAAVQRIRVPLGKRKGWCMVLTTLPEVRTVQFAVGHRVLVSQTGTPSIVWLSPEAIPGTYQRVILLGSRRT